MLSYQPMSRFYKYFRISKPSEKSVETSSVEKQYTRLRARTFWAASVAYSLYYVCRMTLSVVKKPLIDNDILTAGELGIIGSAMLIVYAFGKFVNGFMADYCNVRRFMTTGLIVSAAANLVMGAIGLLHGVLGLTSAMTMVCFAVMWGFNGWTQSMGAPAGIVSLSRWFPLSSRGIYYSIFCGTPYLGKFISFITTGLIVGWAGWEYGFFFAAIAGLVGAIIAGTLVSDTPESEGLPSVQTLYGEKKKQADGLPTKEIQKLVFRHPGIWVMALSSAFVYIAQYAVSGWGVLFLQEAKDFSLAKASQAIAFSEAFGILGTVTAGWLSDKVFRGDRVKPVLISGILSCISLGLFLFSGGGLLLNILYVSVFSVSIGVLYCIVAGLMALDIVPRKATGAALGIVGISSYVAAGIQDVASGFMIQGHTSFTPVSLFWLIACLLAFILPVFGWSKMKEGIS